MLLVDGLPHIFETLDNFHKQTSPLVRLTKLVAFPTRGRARTRPRSIHGIERNTKNEREITVVCTAVKLTTPRGASYIIKQIRNGVLVAVEHSERGIEQSDEGQRLWGAHIGSAESGPRPQFLFIDSAMAPRGYKHRGKLSVARSVSAILVSFFVFGSPTLCLCTRSRRANL